MASTTRCRHRLGGALALAAALLAAGLAASNAPASAAEVSVVPMGEPPTSGFSVVPTDQRPAISATAFSLNYGPGLAGNLAAQNAFDRAAARWAALLRDPITIVIDVDVASLGPGILGQSDSVLLAGPFDAVRDLVAAGGESAGGFGDAREASLLPLLPTSTQFTAYLPTGFAMNASSLTHANYMALTGSRLVDPDTGLPIPTDGEITFSTNFSWDYDPSDGIDAGKYDFEGIAVHEMGHILGFISDVDWVDYCLFNGWTSDEVWPTTWDFFRFRAEDVGAGFDFTTTPRDMTPGGDQVFYYEDGTAALSTGYYTGDGHQASHWKDDLGLGIMDPTAASGEVLTIGLNDLIALDLIGWDVVPEPATLALLGAGAAAMLLRRRRA
jgi:hypothetical protein